MSQFTYSQNGFALTKQYEGLSLIAYQDSSARWTIGFGHTGAGVHEGLIITDEQADAFLIADMEDATTCVNEAVTSLISQNQFDSLSDFCFNVGRGNFLSSTLLHMVNLGDFIGAAAQFSLWDHAGGEVVPGLVARRKAEAAMFIGAV